MPDEPGCPELSAGVFRTILDISPHPVLIHDGHMIAYVNQATCRLFKAVSPGQLIGSTLRDIVHTDSLAAAAERVKMVIQEGHSFDSVPVKLTALDGEPFRAEVMGLRIYDGGCPYVLTAPTSVNGEPIP